MTRSESIVHETYAKHPDLWEKAWQKEVIRQLAQAAKGGLTSVNPIRYGSQVAALGNPAARATFVKNEISSIIEELVASQGQFRLLLRKAFEDSDVGVLSGAKLRPILESLVSQSLNTPKSSAIVIAVSEHEVYSELANLLSAEVHGMAASGNPPDEPLALNYSLLVYHLRRWRIPFARLGTAIGELDQGPLGVRGHLISIQNRHRPENNSDDFLPPIVPFIPATFSSKIKAQSDIFGVVESESKTIPAGAGFFHRAMPISNPVNSTLLAKYPIANQEIGEEGRKLFYPQYEHTALLFMSLAGIEFLLRSFCPASSAPDEAPTKVIDLHPSLPVPLRDQLLSLCATEGWNIRNRCMHGSFFEIEGRREDLARGSGIHGVPNVDLSNDGSLPENVSALVLQALAALTRHFDAVTIPASTNWTQHFLLTPTELAEANQVYCDILQSVESAKAWRVHIRDYVREVTPCISTPVQWGIMTWVANGALHDAIPGFYFLALFFEPLLRLTLHLAGRPILQRSTSKNTADRVYRIQYLMLDSNGLLSPSNVTWLTDHLDSTEKSTAERVLHLAMKCRDAFAHGAVFRFTEDIRTAYGHMLVKAIQLVVEAGRRHMRGKTTRADQ